MKLRQLIFLSLLLERGAAVDQKRSRDASFIEASETQRATPDDTIILSRPKLPKNGVWVHSAQSRSAQPPLDMKVEKERAESRLPEVEDEHLEGAKEESTHHSEEEEGAEAEEALEAESFSLSVFLMSSVGALMCVLHLLHWPTETGSVKGQTLRVLNMTFSIFVAVLVYGSVKACLIDITKPGLIASVVMTLVLFIVLYIGSHYFLFRLKGGDPESLSAASTILAHITGFAAMYGFSDVQEIEFFEERGSTGIVMVISIAAIAISAVALAMNKVMGLLRVKAFAEGKEEEGVDEWIDTCREADDDVLCLAISFLVTGLIRYIIRGKNYPYEPGKVGNVTHKECGQLACCCVCSFLIVGLGAVVIQYTHKALPQFGKRVFVVFQHMTSMVTAWACLFYAEWQIYVMGWESTVIGGSLVVACFVTFLSLFAVLVLDLWNSRVEGGMMLGRALKSAELALGVLIGFSWERAFDVGFEEISLKMEKSGYAHASPEVIVVLLSAILFAVVYPAWRLYILPAAIAEEKMEAEKEKKASERDLTDAP
mmetsp:Transcript_27222/g.51357  ORF Transcript_27222/g.51357 Transcript_27222/m.51357 type:complete len:541 (+) Transcript_27222:77-1699(+)